MLDIVPEGTPTEVVEHRIFEEERICEACGAVMKEIGMGPEDGFSPVLDPGGCILHLYP